jgi:hypothetical protein
MSTSNEQENRAQIGEVPTSCIVKILSRSHWPLSQSCQSYPHPGIGVQRRKGLKNKHANHSRIIAAIYATATAMDIDLMARAEGGEGK